MKAKTRVEQKPICPLCDAKQRAEQTITELNETWRERKDKIILEALGPKPVRPAGLTDNQWAYMQWRAEQQGKRKGRAKACFLSRPGASARGASDGVGTYQSLNYCNFNNTGHKE